jgi:hypothetical protein
MYISVMCKGDCMITKFEFDVMVMFDVYFIVNVFLENAIH